MTHRNKEEFDIAIARLTKLANHLLTGKLYHDVFDITCYSSKDILGLGTRGCAIGECPKVFPEDWKFNRDQRPTLRDKKFEFYPIDQQACYYFKLNDVEFNYLFIPTNSTHSVDITKDEVALYILEFIESKKVIT